MRVALRIAAVLFAGFLVAVPAGPAGAQAANPDPARFAEAIAGFALQDAQNTWPRDAVLFVGSSSIRRWATAEDFPDLTVINRGFGGSHVSDVNHYVEQTVLKYSPAVVVFYAGNNDINVGKTPEQVLRDYRRFADTVTARSPRTQILYVSIHPSLQRWEHWPQMREANALIRELSESRPNLHFVDIAPPMLGPDSAPIPDLFVEDGLHLSAAGYAVWTPIIARAIASVMEP